MRAIIILIVVIVSVNGSPLSDREIVQWDEFKLNYNKHYETADEESFRQQIFKQTLREIQKHNEKFKSGIVTYTKGINQFSDMTKDEFVRSLTPFNLTEITRSTDVYVPPADLQQPEECDWRNKGAVTPVKDQAQCGSCWAFSATGALESQLFIKRGNLVRLSEQNLVDCAGKQGNQGCKGGLPHLAFQYIADNGGIDTEESYPYEAKDAACRFNPNTIGGTTQGPREVQKGEESLKGSVYSIGPLSVAVNAEPIQRYHSGIFNEACDPNNLNHAVLAVGYGSDNGNDYWILKNSWGTGWGENGYIRLARNRGNLCGVSSYIIYPIV